jgi:hypothetical protein
MTLRDCLVAPAPIRRGLPRTRIVEDVLYVPHSAARGRPSALFACRSHRFVAESVDYRGRGRRTPSWQRTDWPDDLPEDWRRAVPEAPEPAYLFLGGAHMHFGHFLVTTLPRFWPLLGREPLPPILCHAPTIPALWQPFGFAIAILARLGLTVADIHAFDGPMRLRRAVVPAPAFQEEAFAHPVFRDLCAAIGAGCYAPEEIGCEARPAYLAKTRLAGGVRRFVNEDEVVAVLDREGVEIVHPETMAFAEQVRLFATRQGVAGSLGSAFHTALFAPGGRRVVVLSPDPAVNATFALVDALAGNAVAYLHQPGTAAILGERFGMEHRLPDPRGAAEGMLRRMAGAAPRPRLGWRERFAAGWSALAGRIGGGS